MSEEFENFKTKNPTPLKIAYSVIALFLFGCYLFIYQYIPFNDSLNDVALNSITILASFFVALAAAAIYFHYHPEDYPRKVWLNLMIGSCLWFLAELIWAVLDYFSGEVSTPSIADAGWVGGFIFFTIAFYYQYAIVSPSQKKSIRNTALGIWIIALLIPLIVLFVMRAFTIEAYINYWYSFADLAVGVAGLMLVFVFRGGALLRPWLGLVVFGVSDLMYAWAEQTGVYGWSSENNSLLTLGIDSSYLAAYLILGLGFLGHWILINYGLRGKSD